MKKFNSLHFPQKWLERESQSCVLQGDLGFWGKPRIRAKTQKKRRNVQFKVFFTKTVVKTDSFWTCSYYFFLFDVLCTVVPGILEEKSHEKKRLCQNVFEVWNVRILCFPWVWALTLGFH